MPRKTNDLDEKKVDKKSTVKKAAASKKATSKTAKTTSTTKKAAAQTVKKVTNTKKAASKTTKKATTKKSVTATTKKTIAIKKAVTKKAALTKKSPSKKTSSIQKTEVLEYYDLPYRYNQTVVKILAQTPNTLFVYWDISDRDRENYIKEFGESFFEATFPVLIVHNRTMNYSFEIQINDFANSWYFNINDAKCDYEIELGRRKKEQTSINLPNNYKYIASSNRIEAPNNHILFDKNQKNLFFRNVKTNATICKDVSKLEFMNYAGRIYNIYDMYKEIYKHEELNNLEQMSSSRV